MQQESNDTLQLPSTSPAQEELPAPPDLAPASPERAPPDFTSEPADFAPEPPDFAPAPPAPPAPTLPTPAIPAPASPAPVRSDNLINISMKRQHIPIALGMLALLGAACLVVNALVAYYTALAVVKPALYAASSLPTTGPLPTIVVAPIAGSQPTPAQTAEASASGNATPPAAGNGSAVIGQDVRVGDARWKVLDAKDEGPQLKADPSMFAAEAKTTGKYIRVRFEVENVGTEQREYDSVSLSDQRQQSYPSTSDIKVLTHIATGERCSGSALNPNAPRTCEVLFDVPADAAGLKLVVGDLDPFAGGSAEIAIGL